MRVEMPPLIRGRSVQYAHGLAVAVDFQNSSSDCVRHVDEMIGRDEEAKRVTQFPFSQVMTLQIENLDACVFAVAHVNQIASIAMKCGRSNWPGPPPFIPQPRSTLPNLLNFNTRELPSPSATKIFPSRSKATSVGWLKCRTSSPGVRIRPTDSNTRPSGLSFKTTCAPTSVVQMLSSESTRTVWAVTKRSSAMLRRNFPLASNSINGCLPR